MQDTDCFADALESSLGKRFVNLLILAAIATIMAFSCGRSGASRSVTVEFTRRQESDDSDPPATPGSAPTYAVARSGRAVIEPSAFKILLKGFGDVAEGAKLVESRKDSADQTFDMPWGKNRPVRDRYSRVQLRFESPSGIVWDLEARAYDDGVAFRYVFTRAGEALRFRPPVGIDGVPTGGRTNTAPDDDRFSGLGSRATLHEDPSGARSSQVLY